MKHASFLRAGWLAVCAMAALTITASAQFTISTGSGPFAPSFRGLTNTTWFGWGPGSFDGTPDNNLLDNPVATLGTAQFGYALSQIGADTILSAGNNIYTAQNLLETIQITIPIATISGGLFTTIIIQGNTAFGGFGANPVFNAIMGISPTVVIGTNSAGSAQFWAEYKLPSGAGSQIASIDLAANTSISNLQVDTRSSTTGYATDTVQAVPEPNAFLFIASGLGLLMLQRRRSSAVAIR